MFFILRSNMQFQIKCGYWIFSIILLYLVYFNIVIEYNTGFEAFQSLIVENFFKRLLAGSERFIPSIMQVYNNLLAFMHILTCIINIYLLITGTFSTFLDSVCFKSIPASISSALFTSKMIYFIKQSRYIMTI